MLSALQQQQIMMLECMIAAYTFSALTLEGARSSERQMMASGWLIMIASLAFSYATPIDKMHHVRPLNSLFHPSIIISIIGQVPIQTKMSNCEIVPCSNVMWLSLHFVYCTRYITGYYSSWLHGIRYSYRYRSDGARFDERSNAFSQTASASRLTRRTADGRGSELIANHIEFFIWLTLFIRKRPTIEF